MPREAPGARGATEKTRPRNRKAKGPLLPFPIEALNRWRPIRNLREEVTFVENWRAVPGAREAECAHKAVLKPTDFHELQPGDDGQRFIVVPGSHKGGAALADAALARLSDFLRVVANDERWATARSHDAIHTLAEASFFTQEALQAILNAFELANKGPGLSAAEKRQLDQAVKTAEEVVQRLARSERFKTLLPKLQKGGRKTSGPLKKRGEETAALVRKYFLESHRSKRDQAGGVAMDMEKDGHPITSTRVRQIANDLGLWKLRKSQTKTS
jgi:hypothetical protein